MVLESDYADYLEVLFNDEFGPESVEREVYTPAGRYCDFFVDTDLFRFAIEVENTSEDVITNGVAQALLYGQQLDALPVVVYPPDGKDNSDELAELSAFCSIIEIPYEL